MSDGPRDTDAEFWRNKVASTGRVAGSESQPGEINPFDVDLIVALLRKWAPRSGHGELVLKVKWKRGRVYQVKRLSGEESVLLQN